MPGTLTIYRTRSLRRSQRWARRYTTANGRNIAASGEGYANKAQAETMGASFATGCYRSFRLVVQP